jgi:hypothetical protein
MDKSKSHEEEIPIEGGAPILIRPDRYEAQVIRLQRIRRFKRQILLVQFKIVTIGPYQGIELDGWLPLGDDGRAGKHSKLVRWIQNITPEARWDKVRLKTFREHLLVVEVGTVEHDYDQKLLSPGQRYSVVREIVGSVGRIDGSPQR